MFLVNVPIGAAAVVVDLRALPADAAAGRGRGRADWARAVLLVTALGLATFAVLRGEAQGRGSTATVFVVFLRLEARADGPILDVALFRRPAFTGAVLAVFMSRVLTIGGTVYLVQFLQGSLQLGPTQSGLLLTPVFVAQMAAGMVGGKLLTRFPPGSVIATGYACKAVGAALLAWTFTPTVQPWLLTVPLVVWAVGGGIPGAPAMAVAMNVTDKARAGMVAGTITSLASIGAGIGTAVLGVVYQARLVDVVATDPGVPAGPRDALRAAASDGDIHGVSALVPAESRAAVAEVAADAVASGASAVLSVSAGLAAVTTAVVLILIRKWTLPVSDTNDTPPPGQVASTQTSDGDPTGAHP